MKNTFLPFALSVLIAAVGCGDSETTNADGPTSGPGTGGSSTDGGGGSFLTTTTGGTGGTGGTGTGGSGTGANGGDLPTGAPGELTIDIVDLADADGKTVIVSVFEGETKMGGICVQLSGNPANASEIVGAVGNDPCAVGAAVEMTGAPASLRGGLYMSGTPAPEMCLSQEVAIDGDTTVTLAAFQSCL